jgi:methyl-accepting chemotaxis protein
MLDVDFKATVNFVVPLQTSYDEMIEELTQLSAQFLNVSRADSQAAVAEAGRRKLVLMEFGVGALIAIALVTAMIILTTVRSIRTMADATQTLADGQTTVDLGALSRRDELGHIVRALSVFRDNILRVETMKSEQAVAEARAQKEKQDALERLAGTFEVSVGNIVSAVSQASAELERSATMLSTNAERGSRESASAAGTAEETTGYVQTVAAASEELSVSIMDISRRVTESASISDVAVKDAGATEDAVRELVTAVRQIGEIVALIEGVAGQTNLLALNATIEAARAGDAGKGFAVVASEVKALANETARATEDIRQQIGAIQTVTGKTESSIRGIVETIARMQELTNGIARSVEQQGAATQEIAGNAHRVAESAKIMTGAIAAVSEVAEETGNGSSQVLDAASHLARQSTLLRQEVDGFIRVVRSA